jgi:hypothetical protein
MAEPTIPADFDLDTAVSADLDGDLGGYADELGVPVAALRAAIASPAGAARHAELAAVRDALRAARGADPGLDELTRRRLLAAAGVGSRPGRERREQGWLLRAGVAAAVTLLVVAGLYALVTKSGDSGDRGAKTSATGPGGGAAAVRGDVGDLGPIDAAAVGRLLHGTRPAAGGGTTFSNAAPESSQRAADGASASSSAPSRAPSVAAPAVATCASQYAREGSIRFRGSGTYGGRAAVVLGIDTPTRTIVFVVAAGDCSQVLYSASR